MSGEPGPNATVYATGGGIYQLRLDDGSMVEAALRGRVKMARRTGDKVVNGDRVMAVTSFFTGNGAYAEQCLALDDFCLPVPEGMTDAEGAAFLIPFHTAYIGLVTRGKLEAGETVIEDAVQGRVKVDNREIDDFILLRADGSPTYMLAVVVDDMDMGCTHIIRGDDHLNNAFRQLPIIKAMDEIEGGWPTPVYAHVPLIHGQDGAKLSKRCFGLTPRNNSRSAAGSG